MSFPRRDNQKHKSSKIVLHLLVNDFKYQKTSEEYQKDDSFILRMLKKPPTLSFIRQEIILLSL